MLKRLTINRIDPLSAGIVLGCFGVAVGLFAGPVLGFALMIDEGDLHGLIGDWADLIRSEGNAGAHSEDYDPVSKERAESISELTKQILYLHYEVPAEVARARESKTPKTN